MAYGYIGSAIRDVGRGIGEVMQGEAALRRIAVEEERARGDISLKQALLQNQAAKEAAAGTVQLAEVETKGREAERTFGLEERRTDIAAAAQQATERHQQGTLDVQRGQLGVQQGQLGLAQQRLEQVEIPEMRSQAALRGAQAGVAGQQAKLLTMQQQQLAADYAEDQQPVNLTAATKELEQVNPGLAKFAKVWATIVTPNGTAGMFKTDANGDTIVPRRTLNRILPSMKEMYALSIQNEKATLSPQELLMKATDSYNKLDPIAQAAMPFPTYLTMTKAMIDKPDETMAAVYKREQARLALRKTGEANFTKKFKRAPVQGSEDYVKIIDPFVNAQMEAVEPEAMMYGRILHGNTGTPQPSLLPTR